MNLKLSAQKILTVFTLLLNLHSLCFASKQIALTIDDLPFVGQYKNFHLNLILTTLKEQRIPATGFIIARGIQSDNWQLLQQFRESGISLGNHTWSHANLNKVSAQTFIEDIDKADASLSPLLTKPKYFRYPYLAHGLADKKKSVNSYLSKMHYHVAPVTIDSKDFIFNQALLSKPELERRAYFNLLKPFYLDFVWYQTMKAEKRLQHHPERAQILLIHANLLNAYALADLIKMYQQKGYTFVSLNKGLATLTTGHDKNLSCPV